MVDGDVQAVQSSSSAGGKIVIDTMNYYPERDSRIAELDAGTLTSSALVQRHLADSRVVKAFNNIDFHRSGASVWWRSSAARVSPRSRPVRTEVGVWVRARPPVEQLGERRGLGAAYGQVTLQNEYQHQVAFGCEVRDVLSDHRAPLAPRDSGDLGIVGG